MAPSDRAPAVLFDGSHVGLAQRVVVALGTGLSLVALSLFVRWGLGGTASLDTVPRGLWAMGGSITAGMLVAALRARTVYRVEVSSDELIVWRDPGVAEHFALASVRAADSAPAEGGWSRDPSDDLVLTLDGAPPRRFTMHDEADTTGVARDLTALLAPSPASASPTA